jgi:3-methyladenine DNA glycosylase AlkD
MTDAAVQALAREIERALRAAGTPDRALQEKRYLKSSLVHLGATVPSIRKVVMGVRRSRPDLDRAALLDLVQALWGRKIHECRAAAVELLELLGDRLLRADLGGVLERFLRDARTWALVDGLAASVAGPLVERFPSLGATLERWAADGDFWIRRSALLAELIPLREGRGDFARFGRHADAMLGDPEFFIRKAIGWVLRDTSRRDPKRVAAWLLPRAARASGLTLREATKWLPAARRAEILAAAGRGDPGSRSTHARSTASRGGKRLPLGRRMGSARASSTPRTPAGTARRRCGG